MPPSKIVVSDASVILDLAKTRLIESTLALSFDFVIPDFIFNQELLDLVAAVVAIVRTGPSRRPVSTRESCQLRPTISCENC